jgi:hypothetical protein
MNMAPNCGAVRPVLAITRLQAGDWDHAPAVSSAPM